MIFAIVSSVVLLLLLIGFGLGMMRSWCRALIRLGITIADLIISLIVAPLLCGAFIGKFASGTTVTIFNFSVDFEDVATKLFGENASVDLPLFTSEITEIAKVCMNVVLNIVIFLIMFLLIWICSYIIYGVIVIVVKVAANKEGKNQQEPEIVGRVIGGFEGLVTMMIIIFSVMIPVFGAMGVCNSFLEKGKSTDVPVASAYSPGSLIAGSYYYTDDEKIGQVETVIKSYASLKRAYDKSPFGAVCNVFGISKFGEVVSGALTDVNYKGKKLDFSDEAVALSKSYKVFKQEFIKQSFDYKNNESIEGLSSLVNEISNSKMFSSLVEAVVPVAAERFADGDKFLGIQIKVDEQYQVIISDCLKVFQSTKSFSRIRFNVETMIDTIKILNDYELFEKLKTENPLDYLAENENLLSDVVISLSATDEMKNNIPQILNDGLVVVYNNFVGDGNMQKADISGVTITDWESEAQTMARIVNILLNQFKAINDNGSENNLIAVLPEIGKAIDLARNSQILSANIKNLMLGFISSEKFNLSDENMKNTIRSFVENNWDPEENPDFKFEDAFARVCEITDILKEVLETGKMSIDDLLDCCKSMLSSDEVRSFVSEIIENSNFFEQNSNFSSDSLAALEVVSELVQNGTLDNLDKDIDAAGALLNLALGSEEKSADDVVDLVADSDLIKGLISEEVVSENAAVREVLDKNIPDEVKQDLRSAVSSSEKLTEDEKEMLLKFFA